MDTTAWALPAINLETCTRCGACVSACTTGALALDSGKPAWADASTCTYCTDCEAACPVGAIRCELEVDSFRG